MYKTVSFPIKIPFMEPLIDSRVVAKCPIYIKSDVSKFPTTALTIRAFPYIKPGYLAFLNASGKGDIITPPITAFVIVNIRIRTTEE